MKQKQSQKSRAERAELRRKKVRLATARAAMRAAELKCLARKVDESEASLAAQVSPAKLTAEDGSVSAVVLLGSWMTDTETGESGPGIVCRIGSAAPIRALIEHDDEETLGPDIAPGDHIRIRRISSRRYRFISTERFAAARAPCNWVGGWHKSNGQGLAAIGMGEGA